MYRATEFTQLLNDIQNVESDAMDLIFPAVYQELRRIAHQQLNRAWSMDTLCTTALVNEAYLKLVHQKNFCPANRSHFFAVAATAMRHMLINYAEQKQAQKRGGDWQQVTFDESGLRSETNINTLIAVNEALEQVKQVDETLARLTELRFFAGMTESEIAVLFDLSERSVRRNWIKAKALLVKALQSQA